MTCSVDDSAHCCNMCHTVAVMASDGRLPLVTENIRRLQAMGCDVVCVVTHVNDYAAVSKLTKYVYTFPNRPLGAKWQHGIDMAKGLDPNLVLIAGSDDFHAPHFLENAKKILQRGYDFVGISEWYMHDVDKGAYYKAGYVNHPEFPVGSGRLYTRHALNAISWQAFDSEANRRLDDRGYLWLQRKNARIYVSNDTDADGLQVMAVKGDWEQLNPIDRFFAAPSIRVAAVERPEWYVSGVLIARPNELYENNDSELLSKKIKRG